MLTETILIGLAAWRITALISYERGPFDIFLKFREKLGFKHDINNKEPSSWPENFLTSLISCPWCLGIYVTAAMIGLWYISQMAIVFLAATTLLIAAERWNRQGTN